MVSSSSVSSWLFYTTAEEKFFWHPLVPLVVVLVASAFSGRVHAAQCACATTDVHVRNGAGTNHAVLGTLVAGQCLPHNGQTQVVGSYTWLRVDYRGQSGWAASNWLRVQNCASNRIDSLCTRRRRRRRSTKTNPAASGVQLPGCPRIVTRAEWGARAPTSHIDNMPNLPVYVFIHHGASGPCYNLASCEEVVRSYQNYHMDVHGWADIGYNFVVGEDGNAYEARGWSEIGAHTRGYNDVGIAICIIGNFMDHVPNNAALNTVRQLIQCGLDNNKINSNYTLKGHRDVGSTDCPGDRLYELIQSWPHYVAGSGHYTPGGSIVG